MGSPVVLPPRDVLAALDNNWLFGGLLPVEIQKICALSQTLRFAAGEKIIEKSARNSSMFMILSGVVHLALERIDENIDWIEMKEGDMFGEMSWLDGLPASATIEAKTDCLLLSLPYGHLNNLLDSNTTLANILLRKIAINLAARLRVQSPAR